ncbi:DUF551 domain-containing protein [Halomonas sp. C22]|uniref:DUF551 domain-containing protein n=1 Tax=Halomonas sp. C22 TaxID=2580567 RepID=UPI0011A59E03|nr:DUF551 domain-containing protein [Halomonas sp. C22]
MSNWKITGPPRFVEGVGMVYPVTKGGSRFNAAEEDELKALLAGWVSVNDRLPEYGEPCLIVANGVTQNVTYVRDGADDSADWFEPFHYEDKGAACWASDVTLWMPMPEPPAN